MVIESSQLSLQRMAASLKRLEGVEIEHRMTVYGYIRESYGNPSNMEVIVQLCLVYYLEAIEILLANNAEISKILQLVRAAEKAERYQDMIIFMQKLMKLKINKNHLDTSSLLNTFHNGTVTMYLCCGVLLLGKCFYSIMFSVKDSKILHYYDVARLFIG